MLSAYEYTSKHKYMPHPWSKGTFHNPKLARLNSFLPSINWPQSYKGLGLLPLLRSKNGAI